MAIDRSDVLAQYGEGVDAIQRIASQLGGDQWSAPACGEWSAAELVGHVGLVADWYHETLDRAEAGDASPSLDVTTFDAWTVQQVRALAPVPSDERVQTFVRSARSYAARLPDDWDLPYGYLRGRISAGRHAALAAIEWHVHAWDLARVCGVHYAPARPDLLAAGGADAITAARSGGGRLAGSVVPWVAAHQRDPWRAVLHRLGRV
jgi:uncharacterized protein (TIGR03083 family)